MSRDADLFATNPCEFYRHLNEDEPIFLIIGCKGILVHDDSRDVMCATRPVKLWDYFFDDGY